MSMRRKEPLGPFAGIDRVPSHGLPNDTLGVLGTKITLHEDALGTISSAVENNLLLLGSEEDNRVDRFDVRLLLDDISGVTSIRPSSASTADDRELEEELEDERYADLAQDLKEDAAASPATPTDATPELGSSYQAVALTYGEDDPAQEDAEAAAVFKPAFIVPPAHWHAMRGMTEQQHKVMMQTARFVRQEGDQLELILRIRQGRNASFRFLRPDSHLYDYYRWLVHAEPQAQEAGIAEAPPTAAATEEPHQASGGALGHLVSMYGASQEVGQDAAGSPNSKGNIGKVVGPDTGSNSAVLTADGQAAEEYSVHERAGQPREAPPTADLSDQEHGRRTGADTGGGEVAEQAAQQAQRAEQPPAEVQGIVAKLLAFVKKSGVKFEASIRKRESSNPRFAFLLPGHRFHAYYREQMVSVLGEQQAAGLLATLPTETATMPTQHSAPAPSAAQTSQPANPQAPGKQLGEPVQVTIRSNPSLAKISFARRQTPLGKATFTDGVEAGDSQRLNQGSAADPETAGAANPEGVQAESSDTQDAVKRSLDGSTDDGDESTEDRRDRGESSGLLDLFLEGDAEQRAQCANAELAKAFDKGQGLEEALQCAAGAEARKADDNLKAERRRLAMQLLAARRSEAEKARKQERGAPTAHAIARHRLALLAEESDSQDREPAEEAEAGEIVVAKSDSILPGAQVRTMSLPKLEEVIRPPPLKPETSSDSSSSSSSSSSGRRSHSRRGGRRMRSSPEGGHRMGSTSRQRSERKGKHGAERSSEQGTKRKTGRPATYSSDGDSGKSNGRHRRRLSSHKERRRPKSSHEDSDSHERHRHKRLKHKKDVSRKEVERHSSRGKASDEPRSTKAAKRHDWGNARTEAKRKAPSPSAEERGRTVSVSEVPDALRARIKAMLAQS